MSQTKEFRFADLLSASKAESQDTQTSDGMLAGDQGTSQVQSDSAEGLATEGTEAQSDSLDQGQEPPPSAAVRFEDILRQKGIDVGDESDPAELYESVISRALAGSQAMSEVMRLREELESLRASQSQPNSVAAPQQQAQQPSEPESVAQQVARRFRELQKYDPLLENYVERDDSGYVKPIASFGQVSIDAARTINEYEKSSREQADLLLRNPLAVVEDSQDIIAKIAEERAKQIIEARFAELEARKEEETRSLSEQQQIQQQRQQLTEWHERNKSQLFHLDANGEPKQDFFGSGDVAWTKTGTVFREKLNQLRSQLPDAPELTLRQLALDFASFAAPASQAAPAAQEAEKPAPAMTQAQQRRLLADSRQPIPNQNAAVASTEQIAKAMPSLRFSDMAQLIPENAERMSGWR
jgi:hypothetical protein